MKDLRAALPPGAALQGLALTALGNRIAIREGQSLRESDTGQYALALDIVEEQGRLHVIARPEPAPPADDSVEEHFERGYAAEESDPEAARLAYEACLAAEPGHLEARINLGRLLHLQGRLVEAERVYRAATAADPLLAFNHAVLLEDLGREADAILGYRRGAGPGSLAGRCAFQSGPALRARARSQASLRHLLAYRRAMDRQSP